MSPTHLKPENFTTSTWAGGATTQLFIWPEGASYAERNFDFRISIAKVETETSDFTALPGFNRKLMILEGEIKIHHENQYSKTLKAFDVDAFKGEWKTNSAGTCTDFNVMTAEGLQSDLYSILLPKGDKHLLSTEKHWKTLLIYVFEGEITVEANNFIQEISKRHALIFNKLDATPILLKAKKDSRIVFALLDK